VPEGETQRRATVRRPMSTKPTDAKLPEFIKSLRRVFGR
jgi:hypothetical protein